MLRCVIIDDHAHAIEGLTEFIKVVPELSLVAAYTDPISALHAFSSLSEIDLILMDIDMPGMSGIELAKILRPITRFLVFTSAHSNYGYQAFKVEADGFLLKPYSIADFVSVIYKLTRRVENSEPKKFFFVKNKSEENKIVKINFSDVIAVESKLNYVLIHILQKQVTTLMTLSEISGFFSNRPSFVQFQRSFIISLDYIQAIDGMTIIMVNKIQLTVGDFYRSSFRKFLEEHTISKSRARVK